MQSDTSKKSPQYALLVAALILGVLSIGAWWGPPRFLKAMTTSPLAEGVDAPQFELESLSGETVSLSQFEGKAVLLKFWSVG